MELAELQFREMQSLAAYERITENARDKRLYRESWIATRKNKRDIYPQDEFKYEFNAIHSFLDVSKLNGMLSFVTLQLRAIKVVRIIS
ncbi:hypothetical protein V1478_017418 [Vespula squamosa]|uniref:Uncharacterized protein n=1 Tax=Vespula squamosa TaxID=30214 RepID=A0ABD1ZX97_VESSQ